MKLISLLRCSFVISTLALASCSTSDVQAVMGNGSVIANEPSKFTPTSPSKVKLYFGNQSMPKHYRIIGHVSADNYTMVATSYSQESISQHLKEQAAMIGGKGIININTGLDRTTGDVIR